MNNDIRELLTFARLEARKCVKERWRSEGLKLSDWSMFELRIASEQYLADHWIALKPKAEELLAYSKAQAKARHRMLDNAHQPYSSAQRSLSSCD